MIAQWSLDQALADTKNHTKHYSDDRHENWYT